MADLYLSHGFYLSALALLCFYISVTDFLYRKIGNYALVVLVVLNVFLSPLSIHATSFLLVLCGGLILYALIPIGAGDIKYAAALSLVIPLSDLSSAYILTALAGGILSLIYLIFKILFKDKPSSKEGIPYGIAISIGFYLIVLIQNKPDI